MNGWPHTAFFEEFDQAFDATGRSVTLYCDRSSWHQHPLAIKSAAKRRKLDPCPVSPKEMLRRHHISKFDVIWLSESVFVSSVKLHIRDDRSWTTIEAFQYRIGLISRNRENEMNLYVYSVSSFKKSKVEATSVAVQPSKLPMNFVKELVKGLPPNYWSALKLKLGKSWMFPPCFCAEFLSILPLDSLLPTDTAPDTKRMFALALQVKAVNKGILYRKATHWRKKPSANASLLFQMLLGATTINSMMRIDAHLPPSYRGIAF
jgi:hypothetical protein